MIASGQRRAARGWFTLAILLAVLPACGEDEPATDLSGSEGEARSLSFDRVEVRLYRPSAGAAPDQLQIQYVSDASGDKPAVLVVELASLELAEGLELDLLEKLPSGRARGTFYYTHSGMSETPELQRATFDIDHWGEAGSQVAGSFFLVFETGRNLEGRFSTTLKETIVQ
jgi:hypothetical protein